MVEVLVRTTNGETTGTHVGKSILTDSYLEVWTTGKLADQEVYIQNGTLCLLVGHMSGNRTAKWVYNEYRRHGASSVTNLDGHFMVVLYDRERKEVSILHDKLGARHAYYWTRGKDFVFSTELPWLMDVLFANGQPLRTSIDVESLALYTCFQYLPTPHTMFKDVCQLPPASELTGSQGDRPRLHRHATLPEIEFDNEWSGSDLTLEEHSERIGSLLSESLAEQLNDGGQTGTMLSGGYDSTTNAAIMVEQLGIHPITFTATFQEPGYDELPFAKVVADHYGLQNVAVEMKPDIDEMLPDIVTSFESPNADQAIFSEYFVCKAAREHGCRLLVTGEGGDEILGYPRADGDDLDFHNLPKDVEELARLYFEQTFLAPQDIRSEILSRLGVGLNLPYQYLKGTYSKFSERTPFEQIYFGQWQTWLIDGVYMKDSRVAKHFGLDPVFPFMDTRLMGYTANLPSTQKLSGLDEKRFLRDVLKTRVPREILDRKKHKFWLPFSNWFRADAREYLRESLLSSEGAVAEYFGVDLLRRLLDEHETGVADHSRLLWAFLFLEVWLKEVASQWVS